MGNPSAVSEKELRASEEKFRTLIEGSVQGILVHDEMFRVLFINQPGAEMMGYAQVVQRLSPQIGGQTVRVGLQLFSQGDRPVEQPSSFDRDTTG